MRVFIGGAFNGKRAYVKQLVSEQDVQWIECEEVGELPDAISKTIVLAGIESFVEEQLERPEEIVIEQFMEKLNTYRQTSDIIAIITENGRGIVPVDPKIRELRDRCGRLTQQIFKEATEVTRVWYGLAEKLK
jgi:adenosylcobinamide kinase / adenosylcobinamide-phosphate guanylyltransferase